MPVQPPRWSFFNLFSHSPSNYSVLQHLAGILKRSDPHERERSKRSDSVQESWADLRLDKRTPCGDVPAPVALVFGQSYVHNVLRCVKPVRLCDTRVKNPKIPPAFRLMDKSSRFFKCDQKLVVISQLIVFNPYKYMSAGAQGAID